MIANATEPGERDRYDRIAIQTPCQMDWYRITRGYLQQWFGNSAPMGMVSQPGVMGEVEMGGASCPPDPGTPANGAVPLP